MTISLAFEILVSVLLIVTIGYCFALDRRLKALRSGQDGVRQSIQDLVQATLQAQQSVHDLTKTGEQITHELEARIVEAKTLTTKLSTNSLPIETRRPTETKPASGLIDRLKRAS